MDLILTRRSIRKYTPEPVPDDKIKEILKAAMSAPSAGNQQPWHFIIIKNKQVLTEVTKVHPYSQMLNDAALAIVVCGDENLEKFGGFWVQDCSAATQNILLAAHALGLGSVWIGVYPNEERVKVVREILNIPENIIPLSIVSIGYPAEQKGKEDRYEESKVHHNKW